MLWWETPHSTVAVLDFGADQVTISGMEYFGATYLCWRARSSEDWYFNPERLDPQRNARPRPRPWQLDRPWLATALPDWVPRWARFVELQKTNRRVEENWAIAQGWPMRTLSCEIADSTLWGKPYRLTYKAIGGIALSDIQTRWQASTSYQASALAVRPIWLGMVVNTLFYSGLWFAVIGVRTLRSFLRNRQGCCPACGYNLAGQRLPGCPECGYGRSETGTGTPSAAPARDGL